MIQQRTKPSSAPTFEQHMISRTGWLRAAVLGANDGILSTASIVSGVAAGGAPHSAILLAGLAGLVAGATSMATGEYVSVCSQADIENADLAREKKELHRNPALEQEELAQIYITRGLDSALAHQVAVQLMKFDALGSHARDELGIFSFNKANPVQASIISAASFTVGAILPLLVAVLSPSHLMPWSVIVTSLVSLIALGAIGAKTGGVAVTKPTLRVLFWGILSLGLTTLVGVLFGYMP